MKKTGPQTDRGQAQRIRVLEKWQLQLEMLEKEYGALKDELKDVYGELEVKGEYHGNKGTFHHFKRTAIGDIVCSFRTDDTTPSGLKRNTQGIKVKNLDF